MCIDTPRPEVVLVLGPPIHRVSLSPEPESSSDESEDAYIYEQEREDVPDSLLGARVFRHINSRNAQNKLLSLPWTIPQWVQEGELLRILCRLTNSEDHYVLHKLREKLLDEKPGIEHQLRDLPWNEIVRVIYSRAAISGKVKFKPRQMLTKDLHYSIVAGNNLLEISQLSKAFKEMAERGAARRVLHQGLEVKTLTIVNTPGAWLLDTVYTMLMILVGKVKLRPKLKYSVVKNDYHMELLRRCKIDDIPKPFGKGPGIGKKQQQSRQSRRISRLVSFRARQM